MRLRTTLWHTKTGEVEQLAVCVLAEDWEPLYERIAAVGPFDNHEATLAAVTTEVLAWYQRHGEQLYLEC